MAKQTTVFVCSECGATSPRWLGRCPSCGKFNTMAEEIVAPPAPAAAKAAKKSAYASSRAKPLSQVEFQTC